MDGTRRSVMIGASLLAGVLAGPSGAMKASKEPVLASMIQLIATPERFNGKLVSVVGFCRLEFEGNALYLRREDFEVALTMNAVRLDIEPVPQEYKALTDKYVIVEGRFTAPSPKRVGIHAGNIDSISRFERWPSRAEFDPRLRGGR